jgi:hypothetical protein
MHQIDRQSIGGLQQPQLQEIEQPKPQPLSFKAKQQLVKAHKEIGEAFGQAALKGAKQAASKQIFPDVGAQISFLKTEARAIRDTAYGLRGMQDDRYQLGELGRDSYKKGDKFGARFDVHKEKDVGRDPGVLARKGWSDNDKTKLHQKTHKFHTQSNQFIDNMLTGKSDNRNHVAAFRQIAMEILSKDVELDDAYGKFLNENKRTRHVGSALDFIAQSPLADKLYAKIKDDPRVSDLVKKDIQANNEKFKTIHQIKGDYKERDINVFGRVRLPFKMIQAKLVKPDAGIFGKMWGNIKAGLQYVFGAESRKGANEGMVREAVANDLMRLMGEVGGDKSYVTQKLKLVQATYGDGSPKLMLDSTFIGKTQTEKAFPGSQLPDDARFDTFEGQIVDGYLVDHFDDGSGFQPLTSAVKTNKKGKPEGMTGKTGTGGPAFKEGSPIEKLGSAKIKMLLLGDRDALGSLGANKGHVGNHMAMIDPGHSFETNRMVHKAINSDFSFVQPPKVGSEKMPGMADFTYKNFSIFDKAPLSEKMQGIKDIADVAKSGRDVAIFEQYKEQFGEGDERLDFRESIQEWQNHFVERRDYILDVFKDRLAVYDFALGSPGKEQNDRIAQTFDLLDNLEKLTSKSSSTSPNGMVELARPRVLERVEWSVTQSDNGSLQFSAPSGNGALDRLKGFLGDEGADLVDVQGGRMQITVTPDRLDAFMDIFKDGNIMQAVKSRGG